jgi:hypothetical protein
MSQDIWPDDYIDPVDHNYKEMTNYARYFITHGEKTFDEAIAEIMNREFTKEQGFTQDQIEEEVIRLLGDRAPEFVERLAAPTP